MSPGELFGAAVSTGVMAEATSDRAWLAAMLRFEAGLANAQAGLGVVPVAAAEAITACCQVASFGPADLAELAEGSRSAGNPAVALVGMLRRRLPEDVSCFVHYGATSQDVVDTAMMLVLGDAIRVVRQDMARLAAAAAGLAERHRATPMSGRTLLRQALPTTFGARAAGWMMAALQAARALEEASGHLALQLGGPVGTLAGVGGPGGGGPEVARRLAAELGMGLPVVPWHTDRTRVVAAGGALALAAGVAAKVATDVSLAMQDEVGELAEPEAAGRGGSSSMPHKRNPVMCGRVLLAWQEVLAQSGLLLASMPQAQERALAGWQGEPGAVSALCRAAGAAVSVAGELLEGLEVHGERMASNLGGSTATVRSAGSSRDSGGGAPRVPVAPGVEALVAAAGALVDRALEHYRSSLAAAGGAT